MPAKDPETRRRTLQIWRETHKTHIRAYERQYRLAHAEELKLHRQQHGLSQTQRAAAVARTARWAEEHPEQTRINKLRYYETNKELIAKRRRERRRATLAASRAKDQQWREANPGKIRATARRRRAQKKHAPLNDLTHEQWLEIQAAQEHRCYYCGKRRKGKLTQDHSVPLSDGGSHTLHNVIGACRSCNSRKGTRPPPIPVQPLLLTIAPAKKRKAS